jgi:hypothetical protein
MILTNSQPRLNDIYQLAEQVPRYPISVKVLLDLARQKRMNRKVISFYEAFPKDEVFTDKDDVIGRTEAVEIMRSEDPPLEDEVRGAED